MTAILGVNFFHADSAACLVVDGKLIGAVAEERFGPRQKHTAAFPANAIRWLLAYGGIDARELDYIAVAKDNSANQAAKARWVLQNPRRGLGAAMQHLNRAGKGADIATLVAEAAGGDPAKMRARIVNVEHHLAHICSAYFLSPFESLTAGFSYDASGDFVSAMAARCEGNRVEVLDKVHLPHSLGFFYTALCQYIGFRKFGEEYKVMGLASYGDDEFADLMKELVRLPSDGWFSLATEYFGMHDGGKSGAMKDDGSLVMGQLYTDKLVQRLGPPSAPGATSSREMNIARSTQVRFEEAAIHCLNRLHKLVPTERLVMAGGCALNGVANARILRDTPFRTPYLQAASSDDGTCMGAAYYAWHVVHGGKERFHMQNAFWGPEYGAADIRRALEGKGLAIEEFPNNSPLLERTADLISDGAVVGWYQGRSEWGPRALGCRSILANPQIRTMKDTINAKIKRRESFRPFAPSVLKEDVSTYFEQDVDSPFMMHVVKIKPEWRERIPAVTHVDGTGRLQSVSAENNKLYHALISGVKKRTGAGLVLNTSFNENEPIVDTPQQAVDCFLRTDMDVLSIGNFVVTKRAAASDAQLERTGAVT